MKNNKNDYVRGCIMFVIFIMIINGLFIFVYKSKNSINTSIERHVVREFKTVYIIGEEKNCIEQGGKFTLSPTVNGEDYTSSNVVLIGEKLFGYKMTCIKTTHEGNKTITEEIFNYKLSNE